MGIYFAVLATASFCWKKKCVFHDFPFLYQMQPLNQPSSLYTQHTSIPCSKDEVSINLMAQHFIFVCLCFVWGVAN